jgi:hypothetical protein
MRQWVNDLERDEEGSQKEGLKGLQGKRRGRSYDDDVLCVRGNL